MPLLTELRQHWEAAGYRRDMGSAAVVRPPSEEFLRVYHFTSIEYALSSIGLRRLKVARFSDVNDPFELLALNFREQRIRKIVRDFKSTYDSHTGLLCFSADWTNPVLWSHYGAKHRGICLGFNLRRDLAQKVQYNDKRILAKLGDDASPDSLSETLQNQLLCTKSAHWDYEEEVRVFVPLDSTDREGSLYFRSFDADLELAEVILGPNCGVSLDAVRRLVAATNQQAVAFRSRLAFKFFSVVPSEKTVPPPKPKSRRRAEP
jgi:Protein of unknown function (DUF2971)